MIVPTVLNTVWMTSCAREARALRRATRQVARAQAAVLATTLRRNRDTQFGRRHHFGGIDSPAAYQRHVPLSGYEDYESAIGLIAAGASGVLTHDPVELLEPTSGTTGAEKLIPFTAALRGQFQRAVAAWMFDLLRHRPALRRGRAYWSISPAGRTVRKTSGGVPIGFDQDAAYLGGLAQWLLQRLLAVPATIARLPDMESFRYCTLWHLLGTADLAFMSVWSPTFLSALLAPLEAWQDQLCRDLERGWPAPPSAADQPLAGQRPRQATPDPVRAAQLRSIFNSPGSLPEKLPQIWPQLSLISCWTDAGSGAYVGQVQGLLPSVEIQPKGLLATEGCVSIPLLECAAPVLAIRSHFFEFQELDSGGRIHLAHELDRGGVYRVILTTAGGLYRYQLHDQVEIRGFSGQCPLLRFVGKANGVSDLVGEKISEPHVVRVLQALQEAWHVAPRFSLLVPVTGPPPCYRLYLQDAALADGEASLAVLAAGLESGLRENPHYAYARGLGQLAAAQVVLLDGRGGSAWSIYEQQCLARGMRAGNIKPVLLDRWTGWPGLLDPLCRASPAEAVPARGTMAAGPMMPQTP